jgi:hypothetical protein
MTQGNGHRFVYKVTVSQHTKALLKQQHRDAVQAGTATQFLSALRQILERLRQDPTNFGEPLYRLPALKLVVYQGCVSAACGLRSS